MSEKTIRLQMLKNEVAACQKCPHLAETRRNTVFGEGNPNARLMIIGEAAGEREDECGRPFVGPAGQLLTNIIESCGWNREDLYICNTICCRPPGNRVPLQEEQDLCRDYLDAQIKTVNPEVILCLGSTASRALTGEPIMTARLGESLYQGRRVFCTFHPSYLLRPPDQKEKKRTVWEDLRPLRDLLKK